MGNRSTDDHIVCYNLEGAIMLANSPKTGSSHCNICFYLLLSHLIDRFGFDPWKLAVLICGINWDNSIDIGDNNSKLAIFQFRCVFWELAFYITVYYIHMLCVSVLANYCHSVSEPFPALGVV